jgi:hypothetical protein
MKSSPSRQKIQKKQIKLNNGIRYKLYFFGTGMNPHEIHCNIVCDVCRDIIAGFRYKCMVCPDFDLCPGCEKQMKHAEHLVMRLTHKNADILPKISLFHLTLTVDSSIIIQIRVYTIFYNIIVLFQITKKILFMIQFAANVNWLLMVIDINAFNASIITCARIVRITCIIANI